MDNNRMKLKTLAYIYDTIQRNPKHNWLRSLNPNQIRDIADLIFAWEATQQQQSEMVSNPSITLDNNILPLKEIEKAAILSAVRKVGVARASVALGLGKTTIYRKLKEYEWHPVEPELAASATAASGSSAHW